MTDIIKPDLCILGAGALGIGLATKARQRDLSVVLVDQPGDDGADSALGALQRAAFSASAARAHSVRTAAALGLGHADPKPNFRAITEHAESVAAGYGPQYSDERLRALGMTRLSEPSSFVDRRTLKVGDTLIRAGQFILVTGARPIVPDLPGLDEVAFFTPDTILANIRKLSHLVVIGGTPEALELAQAYRRLGSAVTLVAQGPLLPGFDPEMVAVLLRALREEGVDYKEGASVTAVLPRRQGTGIAIAQADGSADSLDVSHILVAMGRVPNLDAALLDKAKLKRDSARPDHLQLRPSGQTSNNRISAIGGAAGEYRSHHALHQARIVLQRASGDAGARIDPLRVPHLVSTSPALAQIGLVENGAPLRSGQLVLRAGLVENAAARASGSASGSAKLIVERNGAIVGFSLVGEGAGDIVALMAVAIDRGLTAVGLEALLLPEPSLAAILIELGRQFTAQRPPDAWARRRIALRRLLP